MADKTAKLGELVARAKELAAKDTLSDDESAEAERVMAEAKNLHEVILREGALDTFTKDFSTKFEKPDEDDGKGKGLFDAFKKAGWAPGVKAIVPAEVAVKTASFDGDVADLSPIRTEGPALGVDARRLYPVFRAQGVEAGTTSVDVLSQKSRALAAPASMIRDIDETSDKPETGSVRQLMPLELKQVASVESEIPNVYLLQNGFRSMVEVDLRLAYERALDYLVVSAIDAVDPEGAGDPGMDLTEQIVFAAAAMAENGYDGSVVALNPNDYAELVLLRGTDQVFAREDPLAGFRFVRTPVIGERVPYLIDPAAAGRLFISGVSLQSFEENAGKTNTSLVRFEGTAAFHIEREDAIVRISAGS